jgi:hypothetical protein
MTLGLLLLHVWGFVLPALTMAVFMPWAGRWVAGPATGQSRTPVLRRMAVHALLGVLVLVAGLYLQGQDGKMSTYIALVLVAATAEWCLQRSWKSN